MVKLGQTTTGSSKGVSNMWLVKNLGIYRNYSKTHCYVVMGRTETSGGWFTMYNGTLAQCRKFIGNEQVVDV